MPEVMHACNCYLTLCALQKAPSADAQAAALTAAAEADDVPAVVSVLAHGANINARAGPEQRTALHTFVYFSKEPFMLKLGVAQQSFVCTPSLLVCNLH